MSFSQGSREESPVIFSEEEEEEDNAKLSGERVERQHQSRGHGQPVNEILGALEEKLKMPDAIMEQGILSTIGEYIKEHIKQHGGSPQEAAQPAIEYLTDGYVGYAQMGSLLCKWLDFIEVDRGDGEENEHDVQLPESKRVKRGPSGFSESVGNTNNKPFINQDGHEDVPDEATFLRQLAYEKFKPSIFANIFSSGGSGRPPWLNSLIADADGRKLIYDLSHRYDDCLLLSFAIKSIVVQPGLEEEVARQGVDLSRYFEVFHRILMVRLRSIAASNDPKEIQKVCSLIQHSALSSLIGYLHVRQILTSLASSPHPWSSRFRRMCQDLEMASNDGMAFKISRFFSPADAVSFKASSYVAEVMAKASGGSVAPTSDIIQLYKMYSPDNQDDVPSVRLLHHPMVVEVLMRSLFNPSKRLNGDALEAHVFVLAVSVSGLDSKDTRLKDQPDLQRMLGAVENAVRLGHKATEDVLLSEKEKENAKSSMEEACCATGILLLLRKKLTSHEYWSAAYHVHKEPPFLSLLYAITDAQPAMNSELFLLIKDALQAAGNTAQSNDILVGLISVLVDLCRTQLIDEILPWVLQWARNAHSDVSREFIFGILEIASPPYSKEFAENIVQLMTVANVRRQSMGSRLWSSKLNLIKEFYSSIQSIQLSLGTTETRYLSDLKLTLS